MKRYTHSVDMRAAVTVNRRPIGTQAQKTSVTWHYNGPAVKGVEGWSEARHLQHIKNVIIPNHISRLDADGPQYHLYVLPNGRVWQLRDLDAVLWHCRNWTGNGHSIAIHVPIGGNQKPSNAQLSALKQTTDNLISEFGLLGRSAVYGHLEWRGAATLCPGPHLMAELQLYRNSPMVVDTVNGIGFYRVMYDLTRVREGPGTSFPVALGGKARLKGGDTFLADDITSGEEYKGSTNWIHRADGLGFIHESLLERV